MHFFMTFQIYVNWRNAILVPNPKYLGRCFIKLESLVDGHIYTMFSVSVDAIIILGLRVLLNLDLSITFFFVLTDPT